MLEIAHFALSLIFSVALCLFAAFTAIVNWRIVFLRLTRREHRTWIPLLGGLSGVLGMMMSPFPLLHEYGWIPLLIDWGCIPGFTFTLVCYLYFAFCGMLSFVKDRFC